MNPLTILDGAIGTALESVCVRTAGPSWTASAVLEHPDALLALHAAYVHAGAQVLTACTFRTTRRSFGSAWADVARQAVKLAQTASKGDARVAGSIAPLEDCYHPELSPGADSRPEHADLAHLLADAGCDILLCETHNNPAEALAATQAAAQTAIPVWTSLTPGYRQSFFPPAEMARLAPKLVDAGASAILVNCVPAADASAYVHALRNALPDSIPVGCYANARRSATDPLSVSIDEYALHARTWRDAGATIIGGCCGTSPDYIRALAQQLQTHNPLKHHPEP